MPDDTDQLTEAEAAARRDDAVRRALDTPYKPQGALKKAKANPPKRTTGKGRARIGRAGN